MLVVVITNQIVEPFTNFGDCMIKLARVVGRSIQCRSRVGQYTGLLYQRVVLNEHDDGDS